ncbi:hypothetical protein NQ317_001431 [Molorchus minor]|uniref:Rho GTPase-activating protein 26 n=1 Tax=Molorchus minor TaxID=1323400 RepID=A0ABQ9JXC8_9CUCU|nr:hypothetical protein NQ317_001431 [Molorchus minor]
MGLDRRKNDKLMWDDPLEWETKTITSALKTYLRNLPEPLMTYRYHNGFIAAVKSESKQTRINDVHTLLYRLPKTNFEVLKILIKHLTNVVAKSDKNLMTVSNLGVCFGPTLLRPEEETVASIMDLKFYNIVVEILIDNYDKIFFNEPESTSPKSSQMHSVNGPNTNIPQGNGMTTYSPTNNHMPIYGSSDERVDMGGGRGYTNNGHSARTAQNYRVYSQPYTCTVTSYIEPPISTSMYSVHEPTNGGYPMSRSEHIPNRQPTTQQRLKHFMPTVTSQSETNLPNLRSCSPNSARTYSRLEPNSTSSSSESVFSTSRESNSFGVTPKKTERSRVYTGYPMAYKSPGNVTLLNKEPTLLNTSSGRSSPVFGRESKNFICLFGEHDGELSFEPNQIITNVKGSQEPGWLEGTLNGKTGLIPENYVEMLP